MFSISGWVRSMFRDAALNGVKDALAAITPEGEDAPATVADLRRMLAESVAPKQLAAPDTDDSPARGGKRGGR